MRSVGQNMDPQEQMVDDIEIMMPCCARRVSVKSSSEATFFSGTALGRLTVVLAGYAKALCAGGALRDAGRLDM